jgi:hypothetical protein
MELDYAFVVKTSYQWETVKSFVPKGKPVNGILCNTGITKKQLGLT